MIKQTRFKKRRIKNIEKNILAGIILAGLLHTHHCIAQSAPETPAPPKYPKVVGYLSFIIPWVTVDKNTTTTEFQNATSIGFPTGINVFYSSRFGFSFEFTPTIKATDASSKTSNLLFDPGPMFRFSHGFTFIPRLAFETGGRYGFTPVFNEVFLHTKPINYFIAFSLPARFGNNAPASLGLNMQLGCIFN